MKISDPFNRVSSKREAEYKALKQQLEKLGIDSQEKALAMLKQSRNNTLMFALILIAICLGIVVVWPKSVGITLVFGGLILLWLIMTHVRGQGLVKRYIEQDCPSNSA